MFEIDKEQFGDFVAARRKGATINAEGAGAEAFNIG